MSNKLVPTLLVYLWLRELFRLLLRVEGVPESNVVLNMFFAFILVYVSALSFLVRIDINFLFLLNTCLRVGISIIWKIACIFNLPSAAAFLLGRGLTLVCHFYIQHGKYVRPIYLIVAILAISNLIYVESILDSNFFRIFFS